MSYPSRPEETFSCLPQKMRRQQHDPIFLGLEPISRKPVSGAISGPFVSHHCLARHALCAKKQKRNKKMKEMKINCDLHLSCTPIPLSAAKDKCTSFTWIFFHLQFYSFLLFFVSYTFSKKGPYKSLHFKSLVKMHLFLNYFSIYRQFSKENIHTSGYKSGSSSIFRLAVVSLWQKSTIRWHSSAAV